MDTIELSNEYDWMKPEAAQIKAITEACLGFFGGEEVRFFGEVERTGVVRSKKTFDAGPLLYEALTPLPDRVSINLNTTDSGRRLYADMKTGEARGRIFLILNQPEASMEAGVQFIGDLSIKFPFLVKKEPPKTRENTFELTQAFYTERTITGEWFDTLQQSLFRLCKDADFFYGYYFNRAEPNSRKQINDAATWKRELQRTLDQIVRANCYLKNKDLEISMDIDLVREVIDIRVRADNEPAAAAIIGEIKKDLQLRKLTGNRYQAPQSSGRYTIKAWMNESFGTLLQDVFAPPFFQKAPLLTRATVQEKIDDNIAETPFEDLESFIARVKNPKPYSELHLMASGTQGRVIGIHVEKNLQELLISSSLGPEDFPQLTRLFKSGMNLKKVEEQSGKKEPEPADKKDSLWAKIWIPGLMLVTGFVLSAAFWIALFPRYELHITVPPPDKDKQVTLAYSEVPVEWVVMKEQWFHRVTDRNSIAVIRILKDGLYETLRLKDRRPGVTVSLKPGMYDIEVYQVSSNISDKVRVFIK